MLCTSCEEEQADPPDQLFQLEDRALDAGLCIGVVILYAIQQLAQHPVGICLHCIHHFLRQRLNIPSFHGAIKVLTQQGCKEGGD